MIKEIQLGETVSYEEIKQTIPDIDFPDFGIFQILDCPSGIYERRDPERQVLTFYEGNSKSIIKALGITDQEKSFPLHALTRHGRKHVLNLRCKSYSHYPWSMGIDFGTAFFVVVFCDDDGKIYLYLINIGKGDTEPNFHPLREYLSKPYNYRLCHENIIVTGRTSRIHARCKMHSFAISTEERCYSGLKQLLDPHPDLYSVYVKASYGRPVEPIVTVLPELPELFFNRFVEDNAARRSFLLKDQTYVIFSASTAMGPRVSNRLLRNYSRAFRLNSTRYLHQVDEGAASLIACVLAPGVKAEGTLEPNYEKYRKAVLRAFYRKLLPENTEESAIEDKVQEAVQHNFMVELLGLDRGGGSFDISKISVPFFVDKCHIDISRDFSFGEASGGGVYLDRVFKNYILLKVLEKTLAYAKEVHQQRLEDFGEEYIEASSDSEKEQCSVPQFFYKMLCELREEPSEEPLFEDNPVLVHKLHALVTALLSYHALPDKPYFSDTAIYRQMLSPTAQKDCQPLDFLRDLISKSVLKHYYLDQSTFYTPRAAEESCSDSQIIYNIPMPAMIEYYDPHAQETKKLDLTDQEGQELLEEYAKLLEVLQYKLDFCTPINNFGGLLAEWLKITWSRYIYHAVNGEDDPDQDEVNLDLTHALLESATPASEPVIRLWNQLSGGIPYSRAMDAWAQFCGYADFSYKQQEKGRKEGKPESIEVIREVCELLKEYTTISFWHICRVIHPVVTAHITKAFYTLHLDADTVFLPPEASNEVGNLVDLLTGSYDYLYTAVSEGRKDLNPLRMNLLKSLLRGWDCYVKSQDVSQQSMYKEFEAYFRSFQVAYQEFKEKEPSIDDLDIVAVILKLGERFEASKKLSSVDALTAIREVTGLSEAKVPFTESQMQETLRERDNIHDEWTQSRGWIVNQVEKWGDILAEKIETVIQEILFNPEFLQEVTEGEAEEEEVTASKPPAGAPAQPQEGKDEQWEDSSVTLVSSEPKAAAEAPKAAAPPEPPKPKQLPPSEIKNFLKVILGGVPQDLGVTIDLPEKVSEESYELYSALLSAAYALFSFPALALYRKILRKSGLDESKNKLILEQISEKSLYLKEASWLSSAEGRERYLQEIEKIKSTVDLFAARLKTIESRNQPLAFSVPKPAKEIREENGVEHIFRGVVFTGQGFDLLYQYTGELAVHAFELNSNANKEQVVFFNLTDLITTANVKQEEGVLTETSLAKVLTSLGLCYLGICYRGAGMQYDIRNIYIAPRVASTIYYRGDIQQVDLPPSTYQFNENFSYGSIFYNPQTFQLRIIPHQERAAIEDLHHPWISLVENAFFFVDESFLRPDGEKVPDDRDGLFRTNWNISSEVNDDRSAASFWVSPHLQLKEGCPLLPPEEKYHLVQIEITNPILFFQNLRALRPGKQHRLSYLFIPFTFGRWATNQQEVLIFFRHEIYSGDELEELRFYPVVDPLPHGANEKFLEYTHSNPGFFTSKQQIGFNEMLLEHYKELQAQGENIAPFEEAPIFPILPGNMHNVLREDSHGACFLKLAKPATFSTREQFVSEAVKRQLWAISNPEAKPAPTVTEKPATRENAKSNAPRPRPQPPKSKSEHFENFE